MDIDKKWMKYALLEAEKANHGGEVPVGAVIVQNNKLIESSHNQSIINKDATAHAEILVLRKAGKKQKNYRLNGTTLYVTLEPCVMCLGAIMQARVDRVVFGAYDSKTGACGSSINLTNKKCFNHKILLTSGVLEPECRKILQLFFKNRRLDAKSIS